MNPEIKTRWLTALRSDQYRQAKHTLRNDDPDGIVGYCCLGVLCDIAREDGVGDWNDDNAFVSAVDPNDRSIVVLNSAVAEWAGLDDELNPTVEGVLYDGTHGRYLLGEMNDNGATFTEIADLIENQL